MLQRLLFLSVLATAAVLGPADAWAAAGVRNETASGVLTDGQDEPVGIQAPLGVSRIDRVSHPGASYIAVKFDGFNLPPGDKVIVRSPSGDETYSYTGKGRGDSGSFYATIIHGSEALVEYVASPTTTRQVSSTGTGVGYTIPAFARGFESSSPESICGVADQSVPAKCFLPDTALGATLPLAYQKALSVARLYIRGKGRCSGWLIGSEGHLITNYHCISSQDQASMVDIEFLAESASCSDQCREGGGCKGNVVATTSTLVAADAKLDYAVVKLPSQASIIWYGYLQVRASGPVMNEEIYVPQHPRGGAKRIVSQVDGGDAARITGLGGSASCSGGTNEVSYMADTEGGSSGSPVIGVRDNAVVALHHCGGCANVGVDVHDIVQDLRSKGIAIRDMLADSVATPQPVAGQCAGLSSTACEAAFLCTWNALAASCQRWWS